MIKRLLQKWFNLDPEVCDTCEVLRLQLAESNRERRELLQKLLQKDQVEPLPQVKEEELVPIQPQFIPWRVKQQMLEAEDRRKAQLMQEKKKEMEELNKMNQARQQSINELEKELLVSVETESQIG